METNENENIVVQNLSDVAKALLRGKITTIQAYLKKQKKSQINNLTLHLKALEKEQQTKQKTSKRKEIIQITIEINDTQTKKIIEWVSEAKSWFFKKKKKKINKIDKPLARLYQEKKRKDSNKITNEWRNNQHHRNTVKRIL